ncbi:MAG: hypothetical protein VW684_11645, partial [Betaproteobacteria bacterium]
WGFRHATAMLGYSLGLWASWVGGACSQTEDTAESKPEFYIELEVGAEYDSVVSIDELDLSSDEGDYALIADAKFGYSRPLGDGLEIDMSYNYSLLDYHEFSQVDQSSHIVSADLNKDLGKTNLGLSGFYVKSDLDNRSLLELGRLSPYLSGFFAKGWFARAGVVYSDKTNDVNPGRDATAVIGEIDLYHFPTGKPWFINVGYKYRDEDASAAQFDYAGNTYKVRYVHRFALWERKARFEASLRRLDRDYRSNTPSIGEERFDRRDRARLALQFNLSRRVEAEFYYTYSDWDSNLESVNFSQDVAGLLLRYRQKH